ncbi:MAG: pirin family protein [Chloroflexota bacterium]
MLFDHFAFNDPIEGPIKGFPTHPHRGIETVTCMLEGSVRHRDSLGNVGIIGPGGRAMDDQRRHHPRRDAAPWAERPGQRIPALGQPACGSEDAPTPLPRSQGRPHPDPRSQRAPRAVGRRSSRGRPRPGERDRRRTTLHGRPPRTWKRVHCEHTAGPHRAGLCLRRRIRPGRGRSRGAG